MSLLSPTTLGKEIRENNIYCVYYFYGHDVSTLEAYTNKLVKRLCPVDAQAMNLHKFDGKKLDIPALADAAQALPLFAERVVITINDLNMDSVNKDDADAVRKILKSIQDGTTVIIYATGTDLYRNKKNLTDKNKRFCDFCNKIGCVCDFALKNTYEMVLSGDTTNCKPGQFVNIQIKGNTAFVKQEIKKLADYSGSGEITKETIDLLCIKHVESDGYSLAMNIVRSRADLVFARLDELSQQNYEPFEILGIISFSVSDMLRAKLARSSSLNISDVVSNFDYPKNREFAVKNMYNDCANISLNRIKSILEILSDTDLTLKTHSSGKSSDMLTLEQGIARCMALRN